MPWQPQRRNEWQLLGIKPPVGLRVHVLSVQTVTRAADTDGGFTETWADLPGGTKVWGLIEPVVGAYAKQMLSSTLVTKATHIIRVPYLAGVTTACRVVYGARTFDVRGVANSSERNDLLVLACEERT